MTQQDNPNKEWHSSGTEVRELTSAGVPDGKTSSYKLICQCQDSAIADEIVQRHNTQQTAAPATAPDWPMRYNITTDETVPVTQKDWDEAIDFIHKAIAVKSALAAPDPESSPPWKFQLAVFPNPIRLGEAFIAEAKAIEPYPELRYKGEVYFPSVPKTEWTVPCSISVGFAAELVRRWNRVPGQY